MEVRIYYGPGYRGPSRGTMRDRRKGGRSAVLFIKLCSVSRKHAPATELEKIQQEAQTFLHLFLLCYFSTLYRPCSVLVALFSCIVSLPLPLASYLWVFAFVDDGSLIIYTVEIRRDIEIKGAEDERLMLS